MKVYGIYPGSLKNIDEVNNMSETQLFCAINSLECAIYDYKRIMVRNMNRCIDISEDEYALEYLYNQVSKFGVELIKNNEGRVIRTGDFISWYEFQIAYIKKLKELKKIENTSIDPKKFVVNTSYLQFKEKMKEVESKYVKTLK